MIDSTSTRHPLQRQAEETATSPPPRTPHGSMPAFAPLYVPGTEKVKVRWMSLTYRTDPDIAAAVLPAPLTPASSPDVLVWIAHFQGAEFTGAHGAAEHRPPYMQGGINLRCRHHADEGGYAVETFVEGLNHGILGREMFGLPKKQVQRVTLREQGGEVHYSLVDARGATLLTGSTTGTADTAARLTPHWFDSQYTAKLIPSAEGPGYDISKLVRIPFRFDDVADLRSSRATVDWSVSAADPLHLLVPNADVTAVWGEATLNIAYGTYVAELNPDEIPAYGRPQW